MYGQWVTVNFGEDFEVKVWVSCIPSTPESELQERAKQKLRSKLSENKTGIWALGDSLKVVAESN